MTLTEALQVARKYEVHFPDDGTPWISPEVYQAAAVLADVVDPPESGGRGDCGKLAPDDWHWCIRPTGHGGPHHAVVFPDEVLPQWPDWIALSHTRGR